MGGDDINIIHDGFSLYLLYNCRQCTSPGCYFYSSSFLDKSKSFFYFNSIVASWPGDKSIIDQHSDFSHVCADIFRYSLAAGWACC